MPVDPANEIVLFTLRSVNVPAKGVVPPMATLFIVDAVAGLIVAVPVPVGAILIAEFAPFILIAPSIVTFVPPPPPHCKQAFPVLVFNDPPPDPAALKFDPTKLVVAVIVVPVIAAANVLPITGGLDKSNDPPKVNEPELVTVPDKLIPDTVPVPDTDVTVPEAPAAHEGTPPAKVKTCPLVPADKNVVAPAPL